MRFSNSRRSSSLLSRRGLLPLTCRFKITITCRTLASSIMPWYFWINRTIVTSSLILLAPTTIVIRYRWRLSSNCRKRIRFKITNLTIRANRREASKVMIKIRLALLASTSSNSWLFRTSLQISCENSYIRIFNSSNKRWTQLSCSITFWWAVLEAIQMTITPIGRSRQLGGPRESSLKVIITSQ